MEFVATSRLADLFSVSSSKNYTVQVLSKQTVTVEIIQLKRSMYDDPEGFIFKHFDAFCNLIKNFGEYDEDLRVTALRVLLQVSEKMVTSISTILNVEDDELDKDVLSKTRNMMKMAVFLLCHFTNAFDNDLSKKVMAANIGKGRKKKVSISSECSEWPEQRVKFLVVIKKLFKLPINKLWDPPAVDPEFVNFVTVTFFKLLETAEVAKDKGMKTEIFRFLGTVLKEYRTGLVYSVKIIQLVQDYEHLPSILAEGVVYFVKECSADTLISDICREATLIEMDVLTQNLPAAHALALFLTSISEACPDKILPLVNCILQFLEWESHVMRNCSLTILGTLLAKSLCSETLSDKEKKVRRELLEHIEAHLLDGNSFVRCRAIQVLKMLMEEKALASIELYNIGKIITKRLQDKASNVRKNAMSFMAEFVHVNQFACQVPLPILKESYQKEMEKLKELKQSVPVIFEDSDEEEEEAAKQANAVIFDDSDDELDPEKEKDVNEKRTNDEMGSALEDKMEQDPNGTPKDRMENGNKDVSENKSKDGEPENAMDVLPENENNNQKQDAESDAAQEILKKQQMVVDYIKNTMNFSEVIYSIIDPIHSLLHSSTQTDILEAIEFIIAIADNSVKGSEGGIKEVLKLVWSKEAAIREAAFSAFKSLYLSNGDKKSDSNEITENLIGLLNAASTDDAKSIQEFIKHFAQLKEIPKSVPNILWVRLSNPKSALTEEEKISVIQLLGMLTEVYPEIVLMQLDNLIEIGLGKAAEKSFCLAMYTFKTLQKINQSVREKTCRDSCSLEETRLPMNHLLVDHIRCFLIDGIRTYEDDQWTPMANEAIATVFSLVEEPVMLCAEFCTKLANILYEEMQIPIEDNGINIDETALQKLPHNLLSRFLAFCGHVAIHYITYLKVDYFAYLRRQEALREKRRRRSSIQAHVSSLQSSSFLSPKIKSAKKRKSFHKKYKLVPPVDEETTYETIIEMCANDAQNEQKLVGALLPLIVATCRWTLKAFNREVQAGASLSLAKFMQLSEQVCQENMQLFATITERSPEAYIRANMVIAMGDLTTAYPNIVEPWTQQIFQRLKDSDSLVRENSVIILTHLILHDFVRIKGLISDVAKCIADKNPTISLVAKYLFAELSKKGNIIYNIIPDIISSLSDPKSGIDEEIFQTVLRYMLQYIEKEKLVEGLVEKLCCRFTDSSTEIQIHELTFCLSILTLNDKCYSKLMEFKNLLKERMSDPVVMKYITNITANAKKNDAKTAAELETFRTELGI